MSIKKYSCIINGKEVYVWALNQRLAVEALRNKYPNVKGYEVVLFLSRDDSVIKN